MTAMKGGQGGGKQKAAEMEGIRAVCGESEGGEREHEPPFIPSWAIYGKRTLKSQAEALERWSVTFPIAD